MGTSTATVVIATRINQKRLDLGVSVPELSASTGIPRTTLQRRLSGLHPFNTPELERVSTRLSTPITDWFVGL